MNFAGVVKKPAPLGVEDMSDGGVGGNPHSPKPPPVLPGVDIRWWEYVGTGGVGGGHLLVPLPLLGESPV